MHQAAVVAFVWTWAAPLGGIPPEQLALVERRPRVFSDRIHNILGKRMSRLQEKWSDLFKRLRRLTVQLRVMATTALSSPWRGSDCYDIQSYRCVARI